MISRRIVTKPDFAFAEQIEPTTPARARKFITIFCRRSAFIAGMLFTLLACGTAGAQWKSVPVQLQEARVRPGSALEALVLQNQQLDLLRPDEATDVLPYPPWLRVWWRRLHPEGRYAADDPSGGYPRVLRNIHSWMMTHQDLVRGPGESSSPATAPEAKVGIGGNVRISGTTTAPRSESDIRINYWNPTRIIAASNNIGGSGQQAQYYSTDGGVDLGVELSAAHRTDASTPIQRSTGPRTAPPGRPPSASRAAPLTVRAYKSTDGGATWTFDNTFSGTPDQHRQADDVGRPQRHLAVQEQHLRLWHNGNPAFVNRRTGPAGWGTPIQVSGAETTGTAIGCDVKTNAFGDVFVFWPATGNSRIVRRQVDQRRRDLRDARADHRHHLRQLRHRRAVVQQPPRPDLRLGRRLPDGDPKRLRLLDRPHRRHRLHRRRQRAGLQRGLHLQDPHLVRPLHRRRRHLGRAGDDQQPGSLNDQFNQWLAVDETTGRICAHLLRHGRRPQPQDRHLVPDLDRRRRHLERRHKITTAQTDETIAGADSGNQYGDYNSLSIYAGKFFPSWTDRRNGAREEIWTARLTEPAVIGTLPDAPVIGVATPGMASISVAFTPGSPGSGSLLDYTANCGGTLGWGSNSPIVVAGLVNGTAYTCQVRANTTVGTGVPSAGPTVRHRRQSLQLRPY